MTCDTDTDAPKESREPGHYPAADEIGMTVDGPGFEGAMKEAQEKSRAGGKKAGGPTLLFEAEAGGSFLAAYLTTTFEGGDALSDVKGTHNWA